MKNRFLLLILAMTICFVCGFFTSCATKSNVTSKGSTTPSTSSRSSPTSTTTLSEVPLSSAIPTSDANEANDNQSLLSSSIILTKHLIDDSLPYQATESGITKDDLISIDDGVMIYRFIYSQYKYFDEPSDLYYGQFSSQQNQTDTTVTIPLDKAQLIAYQVFGIEDWFPTFETRDFDASTNCFNFPLEIGPYSCYSAKSMLATPTDSQCIVVTFELEDSDLVNSDIPVENHGKYKITYQIMSENDSAFLRFQSFGPC